MLAQQVEAAYRQSIPEVLTRLKTDAQQGLNAEEAHARIVRYGKNELASEKPVPWWRKFLRHFQDMLVVLLLVATAISTAVWIYERGSTLPYEAIAIFAIVLLNALMGFVQSSRAEKAIASLRAMSPPEASGIREGRRQKVSASELVPGDILLVEEGDGSRQMRACSNRLLSRPRKRLSPVKAFRLQRTRLQFRERCSWVTATT